MNEGDSLATVIHLVAVLPNGKEHRVIQRIDRLELEIHDHTMLVRRAAGMVRQMDKEINQMAILGWTTGTATSGTVSASFAPSLSPRKHVDYTFFRLNREVSVYSDGIPNQEPLDELRMAVAKWLM